MKNIQHIITLGQDCSTLSFIAKKPNYAPSFFHRFAIYSSDYIKFFDKDFLVKYKNNINIYCKSSFAYLLNLFNTVKTWNKEDKMRLAFQIIYGDKYDNAYIDVIHIDNDILYKLVYADKLEQFLENIEKNAIPHVKKRIQKNLKDHLKLFKYCNDRNLFVRTVKHAMSKKEIDDLKMFDKKIRSQFKKSKLLVITDHKANLKYKLAFVKYLKFDHWHASQSSIDEFNKIVNNF